MWFADTWLSDNLKYRATHVVSSSGSLHSNNSVVTLPLRFAAIPSTLVTYAGNGSGLCHHTPLGLLPLCVLLFFFVRVCDRDSHLITSIDSVYLYASAVLITSVNSISLRIYNSILDCCRFYELAVGSTVLSSILRTYLRFFDLRLPLFLHEPTDRQLYLRTQHIHLPSSFINIERTYIHTAVNTTRWDY